MARSLGTVVVLAYDGMAADEAGVVVEIVGSAGLTVVIAGVRRSAVTSYRGPVAVERSVASIAECRAVVVPGGMGVERAMADERLLSAIRHLAETATWLAAISTGSAVLAASGVATGAKATTHWLARDRLARSGACPVDEAFVEHGRILTAAGPVSAAALAFRLVGALAGVSAEEAARDRYRPRRSHDRRLRAQPGRSWWPSWIRRRAVRDVGGHPADPAGVAEVVLLDIDLDIE